MITTLQSGEIIVVASELASLLGRNRISEARALDSPLMQPLESGCNTGVIITIIIKYASHWLQVRSFSPGTGRDASYS